jgi:hypothetical protein
MAEKRLIPCLAEHKTSALEENAQSDGVQSFSFVRTHKAKALYSKFFVNY